jgi:hypothetical protein
VNRAERETERVLLDVILLDGEQDEAPDLSDMARRAKAILAKRDQERRDAKAWKRAKPKVEVPGTSKPSRDAAKATTYDLSKRAAWERSGGRCEYDDAEGRRCTLDGNDPDHALCGAYRRECERLGAEGLIVACRAHHDMRHLNTPSRDYWLRQAKVHAIRIGGRRLLAMVERAAARNEMKRGGRP